MTRTHFPFYKRLFFRLLLPVAAIGLLVATCLVIFLSPPLEKQLTRQFNANLRLSSALGLQACEEAFSYLLELRLEDDPEMNRTLKKEVMEKMRVMSNQFPSLHMVVVQSGKSILQVTEAGLPSLWQGDAPIGSEDAVEAHDFGGRPGRVFIRTFPFWDWHIVSFIDEKDFHAPIRMAHKIVYWSATGVFLAVIITLLIGYFLVIKRPLKRLIVATESVREGNLEKITIVQESEIGLLTNSFNSMIGSLEAEQAEVRNLISQLRESNSILRLILDNIPVRVFWKDKELNYLGANRAFAKDAGLDEPEEIVGKSDYELSFKEQAELYRQDDRLVMESGQDKLFYEEPQTRPDKSVGWLMTSKVVMKDEQGDIAGVLGTYNDITDLKNAETAARENLRQLQAVYNTLPVIAWALDRDGIFIMSEGKGLEDIGLKPGEVIGMSAYDLYKDSPSILESIEMGMEGVMYESELDAGGIIFQSIVSPILDEDGTVNGIQGLAINITDKKKTEDELHRLQRYLANIIDSMPAMLVAVDQDLRVTQWNGAAEVVSGLSAGEILSKDICDTCTLFTSDRERIRESITGRTVVRDADRLFRDEYGTHYHDLTVYPLMEDGGAVILLDDVTETHQLREQLNHRGKMDAIGQLAGGVAHDFNNMLSGIIGATELLGHKLPNDPGVEMLHAMIIDSAERASGLTQKLLAFARKQHPASTAIDMHETIRDAVALLENSLDKRVRIQVDERADRCKVVGDPSQLQSVFMNLGINASHAMPDGGEFAISTETTWLDKLYCSASPFDIKPGHYMRIEVRDTGCGIEPENLPHIFEPFYTTKAQGKGTGLGLSAVFGTIQQHQGAISVYSEPGSGTVFHIHLPLTRENSLERPPVMEPLAGSGTILIVDDEDVMRITAKTLLENLGYDILLAENGKKAIELYEHRWRDIDLVVLDMIMPEMNGRDCFSRLKRINPDVLVILSSGYSKEKDVAEMKKEGLYGFLNKPYRIAELSREVDRAMAVVRQEKDEQHVGDSTG